ncbi:MAG: LCP family protein [Nitriliruptoraceae bacterium]
MSGGRPGPWGPTVRAGRSNRLLRRLASVLGVGGLLGVVAAGMTTQLLLEQAETNLRRVPVPELEEVATTSQARHFLLVGSDARSDLEDDDREGLSLGDFEGQRSDVVIYIAISEDREEVSLVSFPRDLLVSDGGQDKKLADTFQGGPDQLVRVIRESFGLPVNHYAAITLGGFIEVVRTLGSVEICLDEPLRDRRAGADFDAGCHDMDATDSLAYVRSRQGARADLERIDRQQIFMQAVLRELTATRTLANARQVYRLTEDVASALTTDDQLQLTQMLGLADELRGVVRDGMPMTAVPAYPRTIDGIDYMIPYGPGAEAMFEDLRSGRPVSGRGDRDEREDTLVAVFDAGRIGAAGIVDSTLRFAGFSTTVAGAGGLEIDPGTTTTVFVVPGEEERAEWVAATLGAQSRPLPDGVEVPGSARVVVAVGDDAAEAG